MNKRNEERMNSVKHGFTLIEVLLVVAILGILAGVAVVHFGGKTEKASINATRASIAAICTAIDLFEVEKGKYPASITDLTVSSGDTPAYLRGGEPTDAWGNPFQFSRSGGAYTVTSSGPDGQFGSGDDITSFTNE